MLRVMVLVLSVVFLSAFNTNPNSDLIDCAAFKMTIVSNGQETEWEYENPDEFEFEVGSTVIKGEKAEREVRKMYNALHLNESRNVQEIKQMLEQLGYHSIEKLVVRLKDFDENVMTWSWNK